MKDLDSNEAPLTGHRRAIGWAAVVTVILGVCAMIVPFLGGYKGWQLPPPNTFNPTLGLTMGVLAATGLSILVLIGLTVRYVIAVGRQDEAS